MRAFPDSVLEPPIGETPDIEGFLAAAMRWHFSPDTGSAFWLDRAATLDFDPVHDVRSFADLRRFPNVVDELRTVPVADLIPRGYGRNPSVFGVYESGGTTGSPKRLVFLADWMDRVVEWAMRDMDTRGHPYGVNWLTLVPSGPQLFGDWTAELVRRRGGVRFCINMDPRWVKGMIGVGESAVADRYVDHLVAQSAHVLRSQDVGVLVCTPPLLERLCRDDELVELINAKVRLIVWGEREWIRIRAGSCTPTCSRASSCTATTATSRCWARRSSAQVCLTTVRASTTPSLRTSPSRSSIRRPDYLLHTASAAR